MSKYSLFILRRAQKELARLPPKQYPRVRDTIKGLAADPRQPGSRKLSDRDGWRLRVGEYRIVHDLDDQRRQVTILHVGHRQGTLKDNGSI